ncbi:MAG: flippase-like domain-containing protein [Christensenellaceae bacterium]|jgi:uncharacterized protein (TIRG00374 family)|nr:flippase-like domain-containing protein [Christensenellaceae bacterium]
MIENGTMKSEDCITEQNRSTATEMLNDCSGNTEQSSHQTSAKLNMENADVELQRALTNQSEQSGSTDVCDSVNIIDDTIAVETTPLDDSINIATENASNTDSANTTTQTVKPEQNADALKKKKRIRKIINASIFILLNALAIGLVLYLEQVNGAEFVASSSLLIVLKANVIFLLIAFLCYVIGTLSNAVVFHSLIRQCGYGNRFWLALKIVLVGRYYDNITPWNTGGQPFQVAYMAKANIDVPTAVSLPVIKYTIRVFVINIVMLILFIVVPINASVYVKVGAFVGLVITPSLPLFLIIFSRNVPLMLKITGKVVWLLHKLKIIRNYEKVLIKAQDMMDSFLAAIKYLGQHKSMILIIGLASLVDFFAVSSIPFFIIRAMGNANINFIECFTLACFATMSSGLIPTPGSSGASEGIFYTAFISWVPGGFIFWAVIIWRILVFYLHIFMGLCLHIFDWIAGKSKITLVKKNIAWFHKKTINIGLKKSDKIDN